MAPRLAWWWAPALLAGPVARGGHTFREPMPSKEGCPHCGFASWTCGAHCSALLGIEFNFTHESDGCFEAIPADDRTLFWDMDAYCLFPESREAIDLTCDTMEMYSLNNPFVLFLDKCSLNSGSDITIVEDCHWTCKADRPYYRCKWTFDPEGKYTYNGVSILEKCWLKETCTSSGNQNIEAVCQPMDIWKQAGLSTVLQDQLQLLGLQHAEAAGELGAALAASSTSQAEVDAAWARYNATIMELSDRAQAMVDAGKLIVDDTPYEAEGVVVRVPVQGVDFASMPLPGSDERDDVLKESIKEAVAKEAGGSYSASDVTVGFSRGSLLVEASMLARTAVDATMLQLKLQGSKTLGPAVLGAIVSSPIFSSFSVGPSSVGTISVEVVRQGNSRKDLQAEIERYTAMLEEERQRSADQEESHHDEMTMLLLSVGALCGLVLLLCMAVLVLFALRKRSATVASEITETQNVVVGRPCTEDQERSRPDSSGVSGADNLKGISAAGSWPRSPGPSDCLFTTSITPGEPVLPSVECRRGSGLKGLDA